jgi:hypothetical protein
MNMRIVSACDDDDVRLRFENHSLEVICIIFRYMTETWKFLLTNVKSLPVKIEHPD